MVARYHLPLRPDTPALTPDSVRAAGEFSVYLTPVTGLVKGRCRQAGRGELTLEFQVRAGVEVAGRRSD